VEPVQLAGAYPLHPGRARAFIGPLFGILIADFYLIKRGKVSVDDLFDDTPKGKYWYRNGFNPKAIGALIPSVAVGLVISFIPALHEVANFSWFIGVFLGGVTYRWLAREDRETAGATRSAPAWQRKKSNPSGRSVLRPVHSGTVLAALITPLRKQ
jgi:cytosine/uracil/thiamine/allantoin permease